MVVLVGAVGRKAKSRVIVTNGALQAQASGPKHRVSSGSQVEAVSAFAQYDYEHPGGGAAAQPHAKPAGGSLSSRLILDDHCGVDCCGSKVRLFLLNSQQRRNRKH